MRRAEKGKQKARVARDDALALESASRALTLFGNTHHVLEVEFFDEAGTGLGPTLEFYALVCKALRRAHRHVAAVGTARQLLRLDVQVGLALEAVDVDSEDRLAHLHVVLEAALLERVEENALA